MATDKLVDFDHVTDYISREAAYKTLTEYYHHSSGVQHTVLREALNRVPTADVVEVVRCKDCRYFHNGYDEKCCINHKGVVATDDNGFCHHAERRADNG